MALPPEMADVWKTKDKRQMRRDGWSVLLCLVVSQQRVASFLPTCLPATCLPTCLPPACHLPPFACLAGQSDASPTHPCLLPSRELVVLFTLRQLEPDVTTEGESLCSSRSLCRRKCWSFTDSGKLLMCPRSSLLCTRWRGSFSPSIIHPAPPGLATERFHD